MNNDINICIDRLFNAIFPCLRNKEEMNMENTKQKPFESVIDGQKYTVKRCVRLTSKDGKEYYKTIEDGDIVNCFVREDGRVLGEVKKDGGSWFKQLLLLLATLLDSKKEKTK